MMQGQDKVSQLKKSLQAQKKAEERKASAQSVSPGMEDQYKNKIVELEASLEKSLVELEGLKKKAAQSHEDFLRKHAEFENFRKRMEKEKSEVAKYGAERMAKELFPVLDSMEKAIEHADESADIQALLDGVQLVLKQFLQALEKFGVTPVEGTGSSFDPNLHEAVGHVESPKHPEGVVLEEYRKGYKMHDRLLRPAMVTVSKGSEKKDNSEQGSD